jgi:Ca2+-binding RTX toxin-like protein
MLRFEMLENRLLLASFQSFGSGASVTDVSADGAIAVGSVRVSNGTKAVRWDAAGNVYDLGQLDGFPYSEALAVSADGTVIVGQAWEPGGGTTGFLWRDGANMQLAMFSNPQGISSDGSVVVGAVFIEGEGDGHVEAYRWTVGDGVKLLGVPAGNDSRADAISADGTTVVGTSDLEAVLWKNGQHRLLGQIAPSYPINKARGVSGDGSIVVGLSNDSRLLEEQAFRWTETDGIEGLGYLTGKSHSAANAISADGSTIVGDSSNEAVFWKGSDSAKSIHQYLAGAGVDVSGWRLREAVAVSANGLVIVGNGTDSTGERRPWRAVLDQQSKFQEFTNTTDVATLAVDFDDALADTLTFYASADEKFSKTEDVGLLPSPLALTPAVIDNSEFLLDVLDIPQGKRLRLNPGATAGLKLMESLENVEYEAIFAVASVREREFAIPFRGVYRSKDSAVGVVRPGPGTKDTVSIASNAASFQARNADGTLEKSGSGTIGGADELRIVTGSLNDTIIVAREVAARLVVKAGAGDDIIDSGAGDDMLDGGSGGDQYHFRANSAGADTIIDSEGDDRIDFSFAGRSIRLDLESTEVQNVVPEELTIQLQADIEVVTGSELPDYIRGNAFSNRLHGRGGNDILVGGGGEDQLFGDEGDDALLGDGFLLDEEGWTKAYASLTSFSTTLGFSLALSPAPGANDRIDGGIDDDLIIGGHGDDTIDAGPGAATIFGDAIKVTAAFSLNLSAAFSDLSKFGTMWSGDGGLSLVGDGVDTITAGNGRSLILGGGGNDTITGGSGAFDVLLGNDGEDTIDGKSGINVILGGAGNDTMLKGGNDLDVILGDSLTFKASFPNLESLAKSATVLSDFTSAFATLSLADEGKDKIETGDGWNLAIGGAGNDMITGGNGGFDVLLGNDGEDTIDGRNGVNFISGGYHDDPLLKGGTDLDFILGDHFTWSGTFPSASSLTTAVEAVKALIKVFGGFELEGEGDDTIETGDGWNLVIGGAGDDTITGGASTDILYGNVGEDEIFGVNGIDVLVGGADGDFLVGGVDKALNLIFGDSVSVNVDFDVTSLLADALGMAFPGISLELSDSGDDIIRGGNGSDFIVGGNGHDYIYGHEGFNVAFGDDFSVGPIGTVFSFLIDVLNPLKSVTATIVETVVEAIWDYFTGAEGNMGDQRDYYWGGGGTDIVLGGGGRDELHGNNGRDLLVGGDGDDDIIDAGLGGEEFEINFLFGLIHLDTIGYGGRGKDSFLGGDGNEFFASDEGDDIFRGGGGNDALDGGLGNDVYFGDSGNDAIFAGDGDDTIFGGSGDDDIDAGAGINSVVPDADPRAGDYDFNDRVDDGDYLVWRQQFGDAGVARAADGNQDNSVDAADYVIWRRNYGTSAAASASQTIVAVVGSYLAPFSAAFIANESAGVTATQTISTEDVRFDAASMSSLILASPRRNAPPQRLQYIDSAHAALGAPIALTILDTRRRSPSLPAFDMTDGDEIFGRSPVKSDTASVEEAFASLAVGDEI